MYRSVVISCEHASHQVPDHLNYLFDADREVLLTHRGWDPGAWKLAEFFAGELKVPLFGCHTTRLLIEANRSPESAELFSAISAVLPVAEKETLITEIYNPYRNQIQQQLERSEKPVLHLSIHSFTPIWSGKERLVDIGILFDPGRPSENAFSHQLKKQSEAILPAYKIKLNEPYKGTDDGFTTWLRKRFDDSSYSGIELEVNQKFVANLALIQDPLLVSIRATLAAQP